MEDKKDGLLDKLRSEAGCTYLSDLRKEIYRPYFLRVKDVYRLMGEGYSLREWTEAVNYIMGECIQFTAVEAAVNYLVRGLPCYGDEEG